MTNKDQIYIRVILKDGILAKFQAIKKKMGLQSNSEVIRYLITQKYDAGQSYEKLESVEVPQA